MSFDDERSRMLATESTSVLLKRFAIPSIMAMSASAIYALCDTIFLGRDLGSLALSAMAVCLPLVLLMAAFGTLCYVGTNSLISSAFAANDRMKAQSVFDNALKIYVVTSIVVMAGGYLAMVPLLKLTGASEVVMPYAVEYMQIYLLAALPTYVVFGLTGIMRIVDDPHKAMCIQVVCILLNILIDFIFIILLHWGMRGAALASVICHLAGAIYVARCFAKKDMFVHFSENILSFNPTLASSAIKIGLFRFGTSIGGCVIVTVLNNMLITFGAVDADMYLCAYIIIYRITQLLIKIMAGLGQGMSTIAGFNYSKRLFNRVRIVTAKSVFIATIIMTIGYALLAVFPNIFTMMFTSDENVRQICATALRIGLCTFPFVAAQLMVIAFFQSINKQRLSMFISLSRQLFFLLPMLVLLPRMIGVEGVWWAMCLADVYSVAISWSLLWMTMKKMHESYDADDSILQKSAISQEDKNLREQVEKLLEEKKTLQEQLKYEATIDDLTGLLNRTAGESAVSEILASGQSGMFVLFDCDRFKSINDNIGHHIGDVVLKEVAKAIKDAFIDDVSFRLGGDEFAVCLREENIKHTADGDVDIDATFALFRSKLAAIDVPELDFNITVSGGAVCFSDGDVAFHDVYRTSDLALQQSKKLHHHKGAITLVDEGMTEVNDN